MRLGRCCIVELGGVHAQAVDPSRGVAAAVADTIVDQADPTRVLGTLTRSINFNLNLATGTSQAWCQFGMDLGELGTFLGSCRGSLIEGSFNGHGPDGNIEGRYSLAAGGVPGVGPYELTITIHGTGRGAPATERHAPRML